MLKWGLSAKMHLENMHSRCFLVLIAAAEAAYWIYKSMHSNNWQLLCVQLDRMHATMLCQAKAPQWQL